MVQVHEFAEREARQKLDWENTGSVIGCQNPGSGLPRWLFFLPETFARTAAIGWPAEGI
jgi:hypothetical protein